MTRYALENSDRIGWALAAIMFVVLFAVFTFWGGIPPGAAADAFWLQIAVLFLLTCAFGLLGWHLLIRPLAPKLRQPRPDRLSVKLRQGIVLVQTGGSLAIIIGAIWDEMWHRQYGIPFGEDFFWPPHMLMYFGFVTFISVGLWALRYLNGSLRGSFQQRFRANKVIGLYILNAAFLLYALVSDPFWHWTFGEDLTAWSVPHLILLLSLLTSNCLALYVYKSTLPAAKPRGLFRISTADALPLLLLACCQLIWLQLMLIDWDATLIGIMPETLGLFRPEWLLAANLVACVTFTGILAARLLPFAGAATALGLLALGIRFGLIQLFATDLLQYIAWIAALLPLVAIDLWTWHCRSSREREPDWRGMALAVSLAMLPNALVIRGLYNLESSDNLAYIVAAALTAFAMGWFGHQAAAAIQRPGPAGAPAQSDDTRISSPVSMGLLGGFGVFIVFVIVTAAPPV